MRASWCELFRHFMEGATVDPFEVKRLAGRIKVSGLKVLDLCDPDVLVKLHITSDDLRGDDYAVCHELADAARSCGMDGVLAPSAGLPGQRTIALFPETVDGGSVEEQHSRVQVPSINLMDVLENVRATPAHKSEFAKYTARLRRIGRAAAGRYYRRR